MLKEWLRWGAIAELFVEFSQMDKGNNVAGLIYFGISAMMILIVGTIKD